MKTTFFLLGLPTLAFAFPGFLGVKSKDEILAQLRRHAEAESTAEPHPEKRQLLSSLLNDVTGLLGSVASSISPDNYRPEPGYTFQAPGPNDSRGPCPGLNLLANYGYLPRNGYVNFGQVVDAAA